MDASTSVRRSRALFADLDLDHPLRRAKVTHFNGGPCETDEVMACLVISPDAPGGYVVCSNAGECLREALKILKPAGSSGDAAAHAEETSIGPPAAKRRCLEHSADMGALP